MISWNLKKKVYPYLLMLPALVILFLFIFYPILKTVQLSFLHYVLYEPYNRVFVGFKNFINTFNNDVFWVSLRNTAVWVGVSLFGQFFLGLFQALVLNRRFKFRGIIRSVLFLPWAISGFLIAVMWRWMYQPRIGIINDLLIKSGVIQEQIPFLSRANTALLSVVVACVWWGAPFFAIMFLSALQAIPRELYEAASVDGASSWQKFWYVTRPFLLPTMVNTSLLRTIWIFNFVDLIYIMTQGGPFNSSQILSSYAYLTAYRSLDFGSASSLAVIAMVILVIYSIFYLYVTRNVRRVY